MQNANKSGTRAKGGILHSAITLVSCFSILLNSMSAAYAGPIIIDPSAPGTKFLGTSNGTPQLNIATPQSGVSLNKFTDFNVTASGLVLNNSKTGGVSVIGANVTANPNLMVSGPANIIVNEVTGKMPSTLTGRTEVFGQRAAVIVANPSGIFCNGCAFLNTSGTVLTTGKPIISGARVDLLVTQGTVDIGPAGFNGGQQSGVIGRHVVMNGPVTANGSTTANGVVISGGAQRVNGLDFSALAASPIVAAPTTAVKSSPFAVDATQKATISGGDILVRNVESGLGVNIYGLATGQSLSASSAGNLFYKDVTLTGDATLTGGDVRQYGNLTVGGKLQLTAGQFTLYDGRVIKAAGDITITASSLAVIAGEVSGRNVSVKVTAGSLTNSGFLMADGALTVQARDNISQQRQVAKEYDTKFDPALLQYMQAYYAQLYSGGAQADIAAEMIKRAGQHALVAEYIDKGATVTGTTVNLTATTGNINNTGGAIAATADVRLTAGAHIVNDFLALKSRLNAADGCPTETCGYRTDFHGGEILAGNDLFLTAGVNIENRASDMAAGRTITLNAGRDVVNSLKQSNFGATDVVAVTVNGSVVLQQCTGGKDSSCYSYVASAKITNNETRFDEENILEAGRIVALNGDVKINAKRDFVSIASMISAGGDIVIDAGGKALLTSYVDAEQNYIKKIDQSVANVCNGYGKEQSCGQEVIKTTVTQDGTVLATATADMTARNIRLAAKGDVSLLGARFFASNDLELVSTGGSILVDSTQLPVGIARNEEQTISYTAVSGNAATAIFGAVNAGKGVADPKSATGYVQFLKQNDLLTAVEGLRRAGSGANIKDPARAVGVQSYVSLIDTTKLASLRTSAQAAVDAVFNTSAAQLSALDVTVAQANEVFRAQLKEIEARLDLSGAALNTAVTNALKNVTTTYQTAVVAAGTTLTATLAANQAQYGSLLTMQERRSYTTYGKEGGTYYTYVTVPNPHYVNLKNAADARAQADKVSALNAAETQRLLDTTKVKATFTNDAANQAAVDTREAQFTAQFNGFATQKAKLLADFNVDVGVAMRRAELVLIQQASDDSLQRNAVAKGSVVEGEKSFAAAVTNKYFPELGLVQDTSRDVAGLILNNRNGTQAQTREVTKTRNVGEFRDFTVMVPKVTYSTQCSGYGKEQSCARIATTTNVPVIETRWTVTGTETYTGEETFFAGAASSKALFSTSKAEQDAFIAATAWRFSSQGPRNALESTPRSVVVALRDLRAAALKDIYVTGDTLLGAERDVDIQAGRRVGLLGAINTEFRIGLATVQQEIGHSEVRVRNVQSYVACGKDCGGYYVNVPISEEVWVVDGQKPYDLTYDGFKDIGETLQLGTLASNANIGLSAGAILEHEGLLSAAAQTRFYDLANTSISAGGDLSIKSGGDILNFGGALVAKDDVLLNAKTDIRNEALRQNFSLTTAEGCVALACGREGSEYKAAEILGGAGMILAAGGNVINNGATISAAGSVQIDAGGDIRNAALTSQYLYHYENSSSFFGLKRKKQMLYRAIISDGTISSEFGDIYLNSGRDIVSEGSMISAGGLASLVAERDVKLSAKAEELQNYFKKRGFSGLSYGSNTVQWNEFSSVFAQIEGQDIAISAKRDVTGIGARLFAANDIDISAGADITFDAHQNLRYENRSGWSIGISFGGSGIIEALLSGGDALTAYINTNPSLAAVHRLATGDMSLGSLLNLGYNLPALGSAVAAGSNGKVTTIGESLVEQLNPFAWTKDHALFSGKAFTGTADAKAFLSGITFRIGAYKSQQKWTESYVSQIIAGNDLWLTANKDIALVGGTVASANRDTTLDAVENILVAALSDTSRSSSSGWGLSVGFNGTATPTFGVDFNRSRASSVMFTNAVLTAGKALSTTSGVNTVLMGANLAADSILMYAGRDLVVQSRQNTSVSTSFGFNFSTSGSFGLNYAGANRTYTDAPTTIIAENDLSIYTGGTTYLLGSGVWSKTGKLSLDTGKLVFDNFIDLDKSTQFGVNGTLNVTNLAQSDVGGSLAYKSVKALTFATVGTGTIKVRDLVGFDFAGLNRSPANMQRVISKTSFAIEIPGINLARWNQQVRDSLNLITAATANIPDNIRNQGAGAVDLFRDTMLSGATAAQAAAFVNSDAARSALDTRNNWNKAMAFYGSQAKIPEDVKKLILAGIPIEFDANGRPMARIECATSGASCLIFASKLSLELGVVGAAEIAQARIIELIEEYEKQSFLGQFFSVGSKAALLEDLLALYAFCKKDFAGFGFLTAYQQGLVNSLTAGDMTGKTLTSGYYQNLVNWSNALDSDPRYTSLQASFLTLGNEGAAQYRTFVSMIYPNIASGNNIGRDSDIAMLNLFEYLQKSGSPEALRGILTTFRDVATPAQKLQIETYFDRVAWVNASFTTGEALTLIWGGRELASDVIAWRRAYLAGDELLGIRKLHGITINDKLPPPVAGWAYEETRAANLMAGHVGEIKLANSVADLPGQTVIEWGAKQGTHGNDVISVAQNGKVFLWDAKNYAGYGPLLPSSTYKLGSNRLAYALAEATEAISNNTTLSAAARQAALQNLKLGNFTANTVAVGNSTNSITIKFGNFAIIP